VQYKHTQNKNLKNLCSKICVVKEKTKKRKFTIKNKKNHRRTKTILLGKTLTKETSTAQ